MATRPKYRWHPVGRFNDLPLLGNSPEPILPENPRRVAMTIYNPGVGDAWLTDERSELPAGGGRRVFRLRGGDSLGSLFFAPTNELFACGDAGHDLYVAETLEE